MKNKQKPIVKHKQNQLRKTSKNNDYPLIKT